jgi:general secretion pathway protein D
VVSTSVRSEIAVGLLLLLLHGDLVLAQTPQVPLPPGFGPRANPGKPQPQAEPAKPQQTAPAPAKPGTGAAKAAAEQGAVSPLEVKGEGPGGGSFGGLNLQNVALAEVVDFLARRLKINYILDKRFSGTVTINTYGETKDIDPRALLDLVLRINGWAMVQAGNVYRIVPLSELARMPLPPNVDQRSIPEDERAMLNLIFLKYANVDELSKLIEQFLGPEGKSWAYPAANLLLVLDSRRNMKRTMDLVALFDSDTLARQRVKLFDLKNSKPTDMAKELEGLLKSMSLSKEFTGVKFVPVDRINTLIAVAPNPGAFTQVQEWIDKLDVKVKSAAGKVDTYVYRVRYGRSELLAGAIMMLYASYYPGWGFGGMGGMGGFGGMYGGGMYGGAGFGNQAGGYGSFPLGFGGQGYAGNMPQTSYSPMGSASAAGMLPGQSGVASPSLAGAMAGGTGTGTGIGAGDLTGSYLGGGAGYMFAAHPRVVPNPLDNTLLILATPEEYEGILKILRELDLPPRQVLIEAKIYEVSLTGAFAFGVDYYLRQRGTGGGTGTGPNAPLQALGSLISGAATLTTGLVVGQSRELLAIITAQESQGKTKAISTPSIIATDSVPASINVGTEVPTLSSQAVTGAISGGNSLFANTISNRATGVTLNITARVNPSGVVTLIVNQEVSSPQPPPVGGIQSPSFSSRHVQTQITLQDGDTIAIGGIISDQGAESSAGLPWLHKLPIVGYAFGQKSSNRSRTELVVFMTPRVIYDTNELAEASDEVRTRLQRLQKLIKE